MSAAPVTPVPTIRPAGAEDLFEMSGLINQYAARGLMRPRTPTELHHRLGEFSVAIDSEGRLAACGGLRAHASRLAEIVSLAVRADLHGMGLGGRILDHLVAEAGDLGLEVLFARTYRREFFRLKGFEPVRRDRFPGERAGYRGREDGADGHDRIAVSRRIEPRRGAWSRSSREASSPFRSWDRAFASAR